MQHVTKNFCERHLVTQDPYQHHEQISAWYNLKQKDPAGFEVLSKTDSFYQRYMNGETIEVAYSKLKPGHANWDQQNQYKAELENPELSDISFENNRGF